MANCWLVFQWQPDVNNENRLTPCVVGVFDDQKKAEAACLTGLHYIFQMTMNEADNGEPHYKADAYYPKSRVNTEYARAAYEAESRK